MAAYDTSGRNGELRPQVGVRMNLPLRVAKRDAAVREVEAKVAERIAELNRLTDDVNLAVAQATEETAESDETVRLSKETVLPAASRT